MSPQRGLGVVAKSLPAAEAPVTGRTTVPGGPHAPAAVTRHRLWHRGHQRSQGSSEITGVIRGHRGRLGDMGSVRHGGHEVRDLAHGYWVRKWPTFADVTAIKHVNLSSVTSSLWFRHLAVDSGDKLRKLIFCTE